MRDVKFCVDDVVVVGVGSLCVAHFDVDCVPSWKFGCLVFLCG